ERFSPLDPEPTLANGRYWAAHRGPYQPFGCLPVFDAVTDPVLVDRAVVVTARFGDQLIRTKLPEFEAPQMNTLSGPAWSGVGSDQGPLIAAAVSLNLQVIHNHVHGGTHSHETLRASGNRCVPYGRRSADYPKAAMLGIERRYAVRFLTAPGGRVPLRQFADVRRSDAGGSSAAHLRRQSPEVPAGIVRDDEARLVESQNIRTDHACGFTHRHECLLPVCHAPVVKLCSERVNDFGTTGFMSLESNRW